MYRDSKFGLITQKDGDPGDCLQRTSSYYLLLNELGIRNDDRGISRFLGFKRDLDKLYWGFGRYLRHPGGEYNSEKKRYIRWFANPNNVPRDQMVVTQAALVSYDMKDDMWAIIKARAKNFFLHFNSESYDDQEEVRVKFPDIPAPIEFAQYIRGMEAWYLYPALLVLDLQLLSDLYFRQMNERNLYDSDNMMLPVILSCLHRYTTPWGLLAKYLYSKTDAVARLRAYHSESDGKNGIEELGIIYEQAFNKLIKGEK